MTDANGCAITDVMIICDIVMCFVLIGMVITNVMLQNYVKEGILSKKGPLIEDYTIVVKDPPEDADNPDDWNRFVNEFKTVDDGKNSVRFVTITRSNDELIKLLHKKLLSEERRQSINNGSSAIHQSKFVPERIAESKTQSEQVAEGGNVVNDVISSFAECCFQNEISPTLIVPPCMYSLSSGIPSTEPELSTYISTLDKQLQEAYTKIYKVSQVYITFENQKDQIRALDTLKAPYWSAYCDIEASNPTKHRLEYNKPGLIEPYEYTGILNVGKSDEPDAVLWSNTEVGPRTKYIIFIGNVTVIAGTLVASYFAIDYIKEVVDRTSIWISMLIAAIEFILPPMFIYLTDFEKKDGETVRQKEIHRRLFYGKILVTTIFPYVLVSWNQFLTTKILNQLRNTQLLVILVTPTLKFLDIGGFVVRHILGHFCLSGNQQEYNDLWKGQERHLGERYADA